MVSHHPREKLFSIAPAGSSGDGVAPQICSQLLHQMVTPFTIPVDPGGRDLAQSIPGPPLSFQKMGEEFLSPHGAF